MINSIPAKWKNDGHTLDMLFFFYQLSEEFLNEHTPDSFSLPMHNSITLLMEMAQMNELLNRYGMVEKYFTKYIPVIVDEFLNQLQNDDILKKMLGHRYELMKIGFESSKNDSKQLDIWVQSFQQAVSIFEYIDCLKKIIADIIETKRNDKQKLYYVTSNLYVSLLTIGYSKQYIRNELLRFFGTQDIGDLNEIENFLKIFSGEKRKFQFLILMDYNFFDFLEKVNAKSWFFENVRFLDVEKERSVLEQDTSSRFLLAQYDRLVKKHGDRKICVASWFANAIEPYSAVKVFSENVEFLQTIPRYFSHQNLQKMIYRFLVKDDNGNYVNARLPRILNTKERVDQSLVEIFVKNVIHQNSMSSSVNSVVMQAMEMHSSALESKKIMPLFQNFWTALETLFLSPNEGSVRENVNHSVLRIMQKIYVLKLYRAVFKESERAIGKENLEKIGIKNFVSFVEYLASYEEKSIEMNSLYAFLSSNPLLRFRIFSLKRDCAEEKSFVKMLEHHRMRISWHLERLYRMRNVATHVGQEIPGMDIAVNHLHNYFDYVVNFILCKSANNDFVCGVSSVVFEAKNDENIHLSLIKKNKKISSENYMEWLFGPDKKMIDYSFDCL